MDKIDICLKEYQAIVIIEMLLDKVQELKADVKSLNATIEKLDRELYVRDVCREEFEKEQFLKFLDSEDPNEEAAENG